MTPTAKRPKGSAKPTSADSGVVAPVGPAEALRRIAYLLERGRAETYKVRAFRTAADAIAEHPVEELAAMTPSALQAIPGVGKTTALVIAEASRGEEPSYLQKLEGSEESELPTLDSAAEGLWAALQGDCHSHSDWSDGGSPIRDMAETAKALGHHYWALTDHSPRLTVAHGLNPERLRQQLEVVAELNEELAPFRILTGIEVDILEDGGLDQDEDLLAGLDVVVASVHSKLRMEEAAMTTRMLRAIESPHTDILGHCTGRLIVGRGRPPSSFDAERVFEACAAHGHGRRGQFSARAARPTRALAGARPGRRVRGDHRHRRPRPGPARVAALRL